MRAYKVKVSTILDIFKNYSTLATLILIVFLGGCGGGQRGAGSPTLGGTIGGTTSGLSGTVVLQNNNSDNLTIGANGSFTFASKVGDGNTYSVTVFTQPRDQHCSVSNNSGRMGIDNVTNVAISCVNLMGGSVQGKLLNLTPLVSTFAGHSTLNADGSGALASFNLPLNSVVDGLGNLYVADSANNTIRKIVIATGVVTTLAGQEGIHTPYSDGAGSTATFYTPSGITTDGTNLYVTDSGNNTIRQIVISSGMVSTLAGPGATGPGSTATFHTPTGITTDGTNLYVADSGNNTIRQIVISTGVESSLTAATFNNPNGITIDITHTYLYVADTGNDIIRQVTIAGGAITNLTSTTTDGFADGSSSTATFSSPYGITTDGTNLYVSDEGNNEIRKVVISTGQVSTLAGAVRADGVGITAKFDSPQFSTTDGANLYVTDCGITSTIRKIVIATGEVTTLAGSPLGATGSADGIGTAATFSCPAGITTDGVNLYVADAGNNNTIRQLVISTGEVTTLAGTSFSNPQGITTDGTNLFVADYTQDTISQIVISTGVVTTLAGQGTPGYTDSPGLATFNSPLGITTDGINLYVADSGNNVIRQIVIATGIVSTLAGIVTSGFSDGSPGSAATFYSPAGITTDGFNLYIVDAGNSKIRQISPSTGSLANISNANAVVTSLTTTMVPGFADGTGSVATFSFNVNFPYGDITTDGNNLFVIDTASGTVRMIH